MIEMTGHRTCYRVITGKYPPFSWTRKTINGELILEGVMSDVMKIVSKQLNFCYEVKETHQNWGSKTANGSYNGIIGKIHSNMYDIMGSVMKPSDDRGKFVRQGEWIISDEMAISATRPSEKSDILSFTKPITLYGWLLILFSFAASTIIANIGSKLLKRATQKGGIEREQSLTPHPKSITLIYFRALVSQGMMYLNSTFENILLGFWLIGCLFMGCIYKCNLQAILILPIVTLPFNSVLEFTEQNEILAVAHTGNMLYPFLKAAPPDSLFGKMNERFIYVDNYAEAVKSIKTRGSALFTNKSVIKSVIGLQYNENKTCPYFIVEKSFYSFIAVVAYSKTFPLAEEFDHIVLRLKEAGIINNLVNNYERAANTCKNYKEKEVRRPLSIQDLQGVFFIWVGGNVIGLIVFFLELFANLSKYKYPWTIKNFPKLKYLNNK